MGLNASDRWIPEVAGLSLKNAALYGAIAGKTRFTEQGELLFTHQGISGPLALTMSSILADAPWEQVSAWIDLKPALTKEQLVARLNRDIRDKGRRQLSTLCRNTCP